MAYRIDFRKPVADELKRIATDELEAALQKLNDPEAEGLEQTVHAVRKNCKRVRALVRLVRPALGLEYRWVNGTVRDASAALSSLRDAHAVLATFDALAAARADLVPAAGLADVRSALAARATRATDGATAREQLQHAATLLSQVAERVDGWSIQHGTRVAIDGATTYHGLARAAFRESLDDPSDERLHEWRKRVKDVWYHCQLLSELAPSVLEPGERVFSRLSDALGDNNDLAVLGRALRDAPDELGGCQAHDALAITQQVRLDLIARCRSVGARVHAEKPAAARRRLRQYAYAYDTFGRERRIGELAEVFTK